MDDKCRSAMKIAKILPLCIALGALSVKAGPVGLVLSGGGAKGAYEVGVWQALHDAGLAGDVTAISGSSIGGVNAALFASWPDPKGAERLWLENLGKVFVPNERVLEMASERKFAAFLDGRLKEYAEIAGVPAQSLPEDSRKAIEREARDEFTRRGVLRDLTTAMKAYQDSLAGDASDGICDGDAMRTVLENSLPKNWPRPVPRVYVMALANDNWQPVAFCLNGYTGEERIKRLLASAATPVVFPSVVIDGRTYVDGGWEAQGGDNTPLKPIVDNHPEIKTVVVVYLKVERRLGENDRGRNRKIASAAGVRLVEIMPSEDIEGVFNGWSSVFDLSPERARSLMDLGRNDALRALDETGLSGKRGGKGGKR